MMSLRITVCTSASAPSHSSSRPGARHGVAGDDDRHAVVVEAEPDARLDRLVVGRCARIAHRAGQVDRAVVDLDARRPRWSCRGRRGGRCGSAMSGSSDARMWSTTARVPTGPTIVSGVGSNVMTQRVVITSLRSVMWSLWRWVSSTAERLRRAEPGRGEPHQHAAAGVDEVVLVAGRDQRRRSGTIGARHRAAGAEQGDGDHWRLISAAASAARGLEVLARQQLDRRPRAACR